MPARQANKLFYWHFFTLSMVVVEIYQATYEYRGGLFSCDGKRNMAAKNAQKVMPELSPLLGSAKNQKQPRLGRLVPEAALPEARFSGQSLPFF